MRRNKEKNVGHSPWWYNYNYSNNGWLRRM